jgi:hypothetical protein
VARSGLVMHDYEELDLRHSFVFHALTPSFSTWSPVPVTRRRHTWNSYS